MTELKLNLHADGLATVFTAKSNEETRYCLNGVFVTPWVSGETEGVMMVATDGHILATYFDRDGEANRSAIIDGPFNSQLLKSGRSEKSARRFLVTGEIGRVTCVPRRKNSPELSGLLLAKEVEGTFPDWTKIAKMAKGTGSARFTWSALVMERICKMALRINGPSMRGMDALMPEANGPALFTFGGSCPLSVIAMPMRGDNADDSDSWTYVSGKAVESVTRQDAKIAAE